MPKSNRLLAALIAAFVASSPLALATESVPRTLQECAAMLPPGKLYNFQMSGTIDLTSGAPEIHANMQVDDGTQVDRTKEFDNRPFGQCVARFVG